MVRKNLGVALSIVLTFFMVFGSVASPLSGAFDVFAADNGKWIYIDGQSGNDGNDGSSATSAVKSWDKAKELLGCEEGGIYVVGTVDASGLISTKNSSVQSVKRSDGFSGVMFTVSGEATFANIDVDGENTRVDCEVIKPNGNATINFLNGAVFHNIGYVEAASENEKASPYNPDHAAYQGPGTGVPDNYIGGVVCSLTDPMTILIDGATFRDNNGKGIFFTPLNSGMGGKANVRLTMKSGTVENNKGYFYHNEGQYSTNKVYIYNALIRNNDASNITSRYSSYNDRTGVVYVCDAGNLYVNSTEGAAIFDNKNYDVITQYNFMNGNNQGQNLRFENKGVMLGGGNPNWGSIQPIGHDAIDTDMGNYYAYKSNPSEGDKNAAVAAATSKIQNNDSQVIASNGSVQFGRGSETVPETPSVPTEQGCDSEPEDPTPDEPTNPETPDEPEDPTPDEPTEPETPTEPEDPTPDQPTNPETPVEETVSVSISKTDMYGTEIEGAVIVIKDAEGNEVLSWTSDGNDKSFEATPGVYTLEETNAPEGYQKVETAIEFEVAADGTVTVLTTVVEPAGACEFIDGVLVLKDELVPEEVSPDNEEPTTDEVTPPADEPENNSGVKTEFVPPAEVPEEGEVLGVYNPAESGTKTADNTSTNKSGSKTKGAKTGDSNELVLYFGMIMIAGLTVSALFIRRRKAEK